MCVDSRADGGTALRDSGQPLHRVSQTAGRVFDLRAPAVELLTERHRHRIHQVRAAGLDHTAHLVRLFLQRLG